MKQKNVAVIASRTPTRISLPKGAGNAPILYVNGSPVLSTYQKTRIERIPEVTTTKKLTRRAATKLLGTPGVETGA